jgi:hypothetical protein
MLQIIFKYNNIFFFLIAVFANHGSLNADPLVNTSHLDFLYEKISIQGKEMGIIHIYSNYPDYKWTGDDDEGIACVDDASRASVFYLKHYLLTGREESLIKNHRLIDFLLYMQAQNGFFYNFIWDDHSVNKDYRTSVAEPNFWSWRALWALTEAYSFYKKFDKIFAEEIFDAVKRTILAVKKIIPDKWEFKESDGFKRPSWLPYETASDQASILLLGLSAYCKQTNDKEILNYCKKLSDGIILMQEGDPDNFPYCAFLSWENLWHAWGNLQSYALLNFYEINKDELIKRAALNEINHFYSYLYRRNFCIEFSLGKEEDKIVPGSIKKFPQIAYSLRPMIYACLKAYGITNDSSYAEKASELASWFFGNNAAAGQMYFPENGKCFDGILSPENLNKNSGAESTVEALLTMIEFDKDPYLKIMLEKSRKEKMKAEY